MNDVSLQINLSAGDTKYAEHTIAALVRSHRQRVREIFLVVDCCRPGRTKIVDPDLRFPKDKFERGVNQISELAQKLKDDGLVDRVEWLRPGSEILSLISSRYLRGIVKETHDYGACGLSSYLAGIELCQTPFVLHYDADMFLYQAHDFDWASRGTELLLARSDVLAISPRTAPPFPGLKERPSLYEWPPVVRSLDGWKDQWFSTRCFLLDKRKFESLLPLTQGRVLLDVLMVKFLRRGYPRSPEVMISHRMRAENLYRLTLPSEKAWLLHPLTKSEQFLELVPQILEAVASGVTPSGQYGLPDIQLDCWNGGGP